MIAWTDILTGLAVVLAFLAIVLLSLVVVAFARRLLPRRNPVKLSPEKKKEKTKRRTENMSKDQTSEGITFNDIFMFMIAVPLVLLWVGFAGFVIHTGLNNSSVLENIEATRPLAILLSERAPTLEEAWREAIKDGRITAYEERMLNELQNVLGYTDQQVAIMSARIAAEYALRRGRLSLDQIDLINIGIGLMPVPKKWKNQFDELVTEGKLSVMERVFLGKLVFALEDDEEE